MASRRQSTKSIEQVKQESGNGSGPSGGMKRDEFYAMSPKAQVKHLLEQNQGAIRAVIPKHLDPERMLKVAQQAVVTTPALLECDVMSLVGCIVQCSMMGLEPNTVLGQAYLIPFNKSFKDANGQWKKRKDVQLVVGYRGLITLARNSGHIETLAAHCIHEGDDCKVLLGTDNSISHTWDPIVERGEIIGAYAIARFKDGGYQFEVMTRAQIDAVRDASQGYKTAVRYNREDTPWIANYPEMARKTVIRRLSKYLPLSIELQRAARLDELADRDRQPSFANVLEGTFDAMLDQEALREEAGETPALEHQESQALPPVNMDPQTGELLPAADGEEDEFNRAYAEQEAAQAGEEREPGEDG